MINSALILGVTGIVVSGAIGPGIAAWMANRSQVMNSVALKRQLLVVISRVLLDEAAVLLASGATNMRILEESAPDPVELQRAREWKLQVFPIGQRLQLWLPHDDPVVVAYEDVRLQMVAVATAQSDVDAEHELDFFEQKREAFLNVCRARLMKPIPPSGERNQSGPGHFCNR